MQAEGLLVQIPVGLHIFQQVQAELIQPQVHDGNAARHILHIHHFCHQALQLLLAIFQIALLLGIDQVIIARRGHDGDLHAGLYPCFQVDVLIQVHVRPEVDQLDLGVAAADSVDSAKTLDDPHGVPVNIIVDQIVAVLQVLALRNTVRGNQDIDIMGAAWHQDIPILGDGREAGENVIQRRLQALDRRAPIHRACDQRGVQPVLFFDELADILIQVFRRIGEGGEDQHFLVARIDRRIDFL